MLNEETNIFLCLMVALFLVVFSIDYYNTRKIDYDPGKTDEPENLLQVDFNFKF